MGGGGENQDSPLPNVFDINMERGLPYEYIIEALRGGGGGENQDSPLPNVFDINMERGLPYEYIIEALRGGGGGGGGGEPGLPPSQCFRYKHGWMIYHLSLLVCVHRNRASYAPMPELQWLSW